MAIARAQLVDVSLTRWEKGDIPILRANNVLWPTFISPKQSAMSLLCQVA
jgi:hypothetical protein